MAHTVVTACMVTEGMVTDRELVTEVGLLDPIIRNFFKYLPKLPLQFDLLR